MYQSQLDALIGFASAERFKEELLRAKAHYFAHTGEIYEDDRSFEMRMASFLDYFLLDWPLNGADKTPAQLYLEEHPGLSPEDALIARGLTETRHSLWEVRKLAKDLVRLRDFFSGKDTDVYERRQPAGLKRGDLLEARLIPVDDRLVFSTSFCFHPDAVKKCIVKELKRLKKTCPEFPQREFIWTLSKMRLKLDRYRNIAPTDIYAFDRKTI